MAQQYWLTQKDYQMIYDYLADREYGIELEKKYTYNSALSVFKEMLLNSGLPFFGEAASKTRKEMDEMNNPGSDAYRQMNMLFQDQVRYQMISQAKAGFPDFPSIPLHDKTVSMLTGRTYPFFTLLNKHLKKAGVNFFQMVGENIINDHNDFEVFKHYHKAIIKKTYVPQSEDEKENLLKIMDNYSHYSGKYMHRTTLSMFIHLSEGVQAGTYPKERVAKQIFDFMQNNRTIEFKQLDNLKILQKLWKEEDFQSFVKKELEGETIRNFLNPEVEFFRKAWLEKSGLAIVEIDTTAIAKQRGMDVNTTKNNFNQAGKFLEKALKGQYETCKFTYTNQLAELKISSNDAQLHQDIENYFQLIIQHNWTEKYLDMAGAGKIWNRLLLEKKLQDELPEHEEATHGISKMKI